MNIPAPRLCRLSRTTLEQKFGFHLTGQKNKPGKLSENIRETEGIPHKNYIVTRLMHNILQLLVCVTLKLGVTRFTRDL